MEQLIHEALTDKAMVGEWGGGIGFWQDIVPVSGEKSERQACIM